MKTFKRVYERPTSGFFIGCWIFDGKPWCESFFIDDDDILSRYVSDCDQFTREGVTLPEDIEGAEDIKYIIVSGDNY